MDPRSDRPPAPWPAVLAILAVVGLAIGGHLLQKRSGMTIPRADGGSSCTPSQELVCTDVEHIERLVGEEE